MLNMLSQSVLANTAKMQCSFVFSLCGAVDVYVTDRFAIWPVLKRADGFKMGQPALNGLTCFKATILAQPVLKPD